MNLPNDPIMLMSVLNMKLRDFYLSLDSLCDDLDLDKAEIESRLQNHGFTYDEEHNRFI